MIAFMDGGGAAEDASSGNLKTITKDSVPSTRLSDPSSAQNIRAKLVKADEKRSRTRAQVKGLVDGNPPFLDSDLMKHAQSHRCNVNWRIAEAFLLQAVGAFYDVFSETPAFAEFRSDADNIKREEWSTIVTEEYERFQRRDPDLDYAIQRSQYEMVLYGLGPIVWEDYYSPKITAIPAGSLYLWDNTPSNLSKWELSAVTLEYSSADLYEFIKDPDAASDVGWNVADVREAIMRAHPAYRNNDNGGRTWEWHQQQLRNNNLGYAYQANTIQVTMILFREFPKSPGDESSISKVIIPNETIGGNFLFQKQDYCQKWQHAIAPMYYDLGDGTHHSVKGMGVKFYSALAFQNKLICSLADKSMQPKVMLKPLNGEASGKAMIQQNGDFLVAPVGYDYQQIGFSGMIEDSLVAKRDFESMLSANLGQYRNNLSKQDGNPITATEAQFRASEQARLGKTQLARYYEQMDYVYAERFRRAADPKIPKGVALYAEAKEFQQRCLDRGVPIEVLQSNYTVKASRTIGQGSSMLRQQSLTQMLGIAQQFRGTWPENGVLMLLRDSAAAIGGTALSNRYFPGSDVKRLPSDHVAFAMDQVAGMKVGVPPVLTDSQDHATYIGVFLQAATQSIQSLSQGGNPAEVASFLELAGPAIQAHLNQIASDPSRKALVKQVGEQLKQLSSIHDKLVEQLHRQQQQQAQQQAQQAQVMSEQQLAQWQAQMDEQIKMFKAQADAQRKDRKAITDAQRTNLTTTQQMRLKDATTAHQIQLDQLQAEHEMNQPETADAT